MPSKARRAASRQAQLSRKKRRGKGRPQEFLPGPVEPRATSDTAMPEPSLQAEDQETRQQPQAAPSSSRTAVATAPRPHTPRRTRQQRVAAAQPAAISRYLGTELRHIGIMSGVIFVILVALTFVLR